MSGTHKKKKGVTRVTALLALVAMGLALAPQVALGQAPFSDADFSGYATGTYLHADALTLGGSPTVKARLFRRVRRVQGPRRYRERRARPRRSAVRAWEEQLRGRVRAGRQPAGQRPSSATGRCGGCAPVYRVDREDTGRPDRRTRRPLRRSGGRKGAGPLRPQQLHPRRGHELRATLPTLRC